MVELTIPFPPTMNTYWRYGQLKNGARMHMISKKGREFTKQVEALCIEHVGAFSDGRLSVSIHLYPPDKRRRDIDNYIKAAFDAITKAGVWGDDEQVDVLHVYRREIVKGGKAEVKIIRK